MSILLIVQNAKHLFYDDGICVQSMQPGSNVSVQKAVAIDFRVLQGNHLLAIGLYLLYYGNEVRRVGKTAFQRVLVIIYQCLHALWFVPAQIIGDVMICLAYILILDDGLETGFPTFLILEAGIVPCIVSNREQRCLRYLSLLHGIGYYTLAVVQL